MNRYVHSYNLIASAVAGRTITVHWHNNQRLSSHTDNQCIYLPQPEGNSSQHFEVISQALLIRSGALNKNIIRKLVGRRLLSKRYLYAEICRASREFRYILPRKFCMHTAFTEFKYITVNSHDSLRLAESRVPFPSAPDFIGGLHTVLILRTTVSDNALAALKKNQPGKKIKVQDAHETYNDDEEQSEDSITRNLFENPLFSGSTLADMVDSLLGRRKGGKFEDSENTGGVEMNISTVTQTRKKGVFATLTDLALDLVNTTSNDANSKYYPEWNHTKQSYRKNWALVDEMDPWREETAPEENLRQLLQPPSLVLKRRLSGIGLSFEIHHGQQDGDDYSLDRVVDYIIDYRMGITPDERVFNHCKQTRRDLAVMVLLDISSSTDEKDVLGVSIHHKQMQLAYHVTLALHELGDQVALYAFNSWGRTMVRLLRIKSFKERQIDSSMQRRLAMLEPAGYTRSGAALRHANRKLREETGMPHRVLIVITDGFSYDQGYEGKYGEEDTRKAIEEIRTGGVGCLCLTIGSSQEEEKLAQVYGTASTLSVRNYDQFLNYLRPAMLNALRQVRPA